MKYYEQFPKEYQLEKGYILRLDRMSLLISIPSAILDLVMGYLPYSRPADIVIESPCGEIFKVGRFSDLSGVVGLQRIWNMIDDVGLENWLEMRIESEWSLNRARIKTYNKLLNHLK